MNRIEKDPLQRKLEIRNWIILGIFLVVSLIFMPRRFTLGILLGGLISNINFYWLYKSLHDAFQRVTRRTKPTVIFKFYIRLAVTGIVLFLIITQTPADVIGLVIGLSIVVINIIFTTVLELSKKNCAKAAVRE
ncbi:MAG: ATP synthase subunit I [Proteobacteria bacterium]|nr:ATP synthase subunit I [Pseudomonadota bacterium]